MFEKIKTKSLNMKVGDLSSVKTKEFNLPVLTAGIENQGLNNYARSKDIDTLKNLITISGNGTNTGATFYQPNEFAVLQDAYAIRFKTESIICDNAYLFMVGAIRKTIYGKFSWTNKAGWGKVKKEYIQLPTKNGEIDFEFMESFVAELEAKRVAELEAYLTVTGLKDYELTEEERDVLLSFKNLNLKESEIGKLFEIRPTKAYSYTNSDLFDKNGKYPVVTNSSNNNGITGYTNLSPTEKGNIITYSDTTTSEGIFYQPENFVGYSHIQGLYPLVFKDKWNCNTLLYIVSTFKKSSSGRFDYGNKFNRKIAEKLKIYIPIKNCEIDFVFMETLIRAVQKLVIKDVVLFADKKIEVTKKITNI